MPLMVKTTLALEVKRKMQNNFWKNISKVLIEHLKGRAFKLALKKILGSSAAGGFKAWLVKFILENLWEELAEPLIKAGLIEIRYIADKIDGNITAKKIEKARRSGDVEDYNRAVDSAFD